jgi:bis(5'-nucleosidyl)-tetraphosphatase
MTTEKSCGAVIFKSLADCIEYLAVRSINGHWGFPKGHVEKGESEQETAIREVFEETGLHATFLDGFRQTVAYTLPDDVFKEVVYFLGTTEYLSVQIREVEIQEYKWLQYAEMLDLLTYENIREVLIEAKGFLDCYQKR